MTAPTTLKLDQIKVDHDIQPREKIDYPLVEEYIDEMKAGAVFPPVVVFFDGTDYWLADGFHRVSAAPSVNADEIAVEIKQGTREDAAWYSCSTNKAHGSRRTTADKRRAVQMALRHPQGAGMSDRAIAEHVGVSDKTVAAVRAESGAEIPHVNERKGKDGKKYKTKPAKKLELHDATVPPPPPTLRQVDDKESQDATLSAPPVEEQEPESPTVDQPAQEQQLAAFDPTIEQWKSVLEDVGHLLDVTWKHAEGIANERAEERRRAGLYVSFEEAKADSFDRMGRVQRFLHKLAEAHGIDVDWLLGITTPATQETPSTVEQAPTQAPPLPDPPAPVEEQPQPAASVRADDPAPVGEKDEPRATVEAVEPEHSWRCGVGKKDPWCDACNAKKPKARSSAGDPEQVADARAERLPPCLGAQCNKLVPRYGGKPSHKRRVCFCDTCWKPRGRKPQPKPTPPQMALSEVA